MNFAKYIESRFISSHLTITQTKAPGEFPRYQAIQIWQWFIVHFLTVFYFFALLSQYAGVFLRLVKAPLAAEDIAAAARLKMAQQQADQLEIPEEKLNNLMKARAKAGKDQVQRKGAA